LVNIFGQNTEHASTVSIRKMNMFFFSSTFLKTVYYKNKIAKHVFWNNLLQEPLKIKRFESQTIKEVFGSKKAKKA
jgi:hypothetical protein